MVLSTRPRHLASAVLLAAILVGCGEDATTDQPADRPDRPDAKERTTGVDEVAECADLTGQDVSSTAAPVPGFVACLKRLGAPKGVIEAWESG